MVNAAAPLGLGLGLRGKGDTSDSDTVLVIYIAYLPKRALRPFDSPSPPVFLRASPKLSKILDQVSDACQGPWTGLGEVCY